MIPFPMTIDNNREATMTDLRVVKIDDLIRDKITRKTWLENDLAKCVDSENPREISNAIGLRREIDEIECDLLRLERFRRLIVEDGLPDEGAPSYAIAPPTH